MRGAGGAGAARAVVRAQRLGLARELHDVLAHELSALVVTLHAARLAPDAPTRTKALEGRSEEAGGRIAAALPGGLPGGWPLPGPARRRRAGRRRGRGARRPGARRGAPGDASRLVGE